MKCLFCIRLYLFIKVFTLQPDDGCVVDQTHNCVAVELNICVRGKLWPVFVCIDIGTECDDKDHMNAAVNDCACTNDTDTHQH
jgi:hypothetical protein